MAKKKEEVQESTENTATRGRKVMITNKETGETIARVDFIKDQFYNKGVKRGEIRKMLAEQFGHEVAYQIVFAATKTKTADGEGEGEAAAEAEAA